MYLIIIAVLVAATIEGWREMRGNRAWNREYKRILRDEDERTHRLEQDVRQLRGGRS